METIANAVSDYAVTSATADFSIIALIASLVSALMDLFSGLDLDTSAITGIFG